MPHDFGVEIAVQATHVIFADLTWMGGVLFLQGQDESLCSLLGSLILPREGLGVPHYRLVRVEVCTSNLASAHMSHDGATVSSGVFDYSRVFIVCKFPVFIGCIVPGPIVRERWLFGELLKICAC